MATHMPFQKGNILFKRRIKYHIRQFMSCKQCNKIFDVAPSVMKTKNYCSKKCYADFLKTIPKEQHPSWKGNKGWIRRGYRYIIVDRRNILEHRHFMQQKLGRKLSRHEHVHHINHVKHDNRLKNLLLISDKEHRKLHPMISWSKKYKECLRCGTKKIPHHSRGHCEYCYNKFIRRHCER